MKKITTLLLAVLFSLGLLLSTFGSLDASEEDYNRDEQLQEEESENPPDEELYQLLKEQDQSREEEWEQFEEKEQDYPDERYQDDRG